MAKDEKSAQVEERFVLCKTAYSVDDVWKVVKIIPHLMITESLLDERLFSYVFPRVQRETIQISGWWHSNLSMQKYFLCKKRYSKQMEPPTRLNSYLHLIIDNHLIIKNR